MHGPDSGSGLYCLDDAILPTPPSSASDSGAARRPVTRVLHRPSNLPEVRIVARPSARIAAQKTAARTVGDGWSLRAIGDLHILTANIFQSQPWLLHGFSTRSGGASRLAGRSVLNLGFTNWDSRKNVQENRSKFVRAMSKGGLPAAQHLISLRQVHSDIVHVFSEPPSEPQQGDAAITRVPGLLLAVQNADCVPILLADSRTRAVTAIHAGWRGTLARIVTKTLGRMRFEFGTRPEDVIAAVGPAIGPCCYEVGPEVAQAFLGQFPNAAEWFEGPFDRLSSGEEPNPLPWLTMMPPGHEPPPERVQLDLRSANWSQLIEAGVKPRNIAVSMLCTGCRSDLFFSYRNEGANTGRMLAVIGIRGEVR